MLKTSFAQWPVQQLTKSILKMASRVQLQQSLRQQEVRIHDILGRKPVHPFPARMAPRLALDPIANCNGSLRILDPMTGSGLVPAVAMVKGHHALGFDLDPLAVLISKVWTTPVDVHSVFECAEQVLDRARNTIVTLPTRNAYPKGSDSETRCFIRYWFDKSSRAQLTAIANAIDQVSDVHIRDSLWCAFSRLIITKQSGASLAMDLSHSRPHKRYNKSPIEPMNAFMRAVGIVTANSINSTGKPQLPEAKIFNGDARQLDVSSQSVDMVITSPPYLNAIDYLRCSKFSLVWMGYSISNLRCTRSTMVGTEVGLDFRSDQLVQDVLTRLKLRPIPKASFLNQLSRYIHDMNSIISETSRVLTENGTAVFVVGENTVRGTFIRNSKIIELLANVSGMRCVDKVSRDLPSSNRYLPPPAKCTNGNAFNKRMRREVVLTLQK